MNMQLKNGWKTRMCVCVCYMMTASVSFNQYWRIKRKTVFSPEIYACLWVGVSLGETVCSTAATSLSCHMLLNKLPVLQMTTNDVFFLSVTAFTSTLLLYVHPAYTRFVICVILFCFPFQWSSPRKTAKNRWMGFAHHNRNLTSNSLESAVLFPAKPIDLFHRMFSGRLSSATCWAVAWLCL